MAATATGKRGCQGRKSAAGYAVLEGLQQEQAAVQMGVARTTVQAIYNTARRKLTDCLVNGRLLRLQGGDVEVCERRAHCPRAGCCLRRSCDKERPED